MTAGAEGGQGATLLPDLGERGILILGPCAADSHTRKATAGGTTWQAVASCLVGARATAYSKVRRTAVDDGRRAWGPPWCPVVEVVGRPALGLRVHSPQAALADSGRVPVWGLASCCTTKEHGWVQARALDFERSCKGDAPGAGCRVCLVTGSSTMSPGAGSKTGMAILLAEMCDWFMPL